MAVSIRDELDAAERAVEWIAWPERRVYGPGYTAEEIGERHATFLRSGYSRASSGAYHRVRVAPVTAPVAPWPEHYPSVVPGIDPWTR